MPRILPAALRALSAGLMLICLLAACGLKGDLVLPESAPSTTETPQDPSAEEDRDDEGSPA